MKPMRHTSLIALLLALSLLALSACSTLPEMKLENGLYTDTATGITYRVANSNYSPVLLSDTEVARVARESVDDLILYAIRGMDSNRFLASKDGMILHDANHALPSLWELPVSQVLYYDVSGSGMNIAVEDDRDQIAAMAAIYQSDVTFQQMEILPTISTKTYELRFVASGEYTGLSYSLYYIRAEEDVLVYDVIEDLDNFEIRYPGIEVSTTVYEYEETENGVTVQKTQLLAVYNFGRHLLLDRSTGECRRADAFFADPIV